MIQVIKMSLILIRFQLNSLCTSQQIVVALILEIYCSFILDGFSLMIGQDLSNLSNFPFVKVSRYTVHAAMESKI